MNHQNPNLNRDGNIEDFLSDNKEAIQFHLDTELVHFDDKLHLFNTDPLFRDKFLFARKAYVVKKIKEFVEQEANFGPDDIYQIDLDLIRDLGYKF